MRLFYITIFITAFHQLSAQLDVIRFSVCSDCPLTENTATHATLYIYQLETDYTPLEITSDYGPRNLTQYDWHNGIDLRPYPAGSRDIHRGTAIQSIEGGRVDHIKFENGGYKYIVIGDPAPTVPALPKYGYGHIFHSREVPTLASGLMLSDGNFFLKRLDDFPNRVAIYCKNTDKSISTENNAEVTYPASTGTYAGLDTTTIWVDQHEFIAPMGGSGGSNGNYYNNDPFDVHLHLYRLSENPLDSAASKHYLCTDPSINLDFYESTQYDVSILPSPINILYNAMGDAESSFRARVDMIGANQIGERFTNVLMKSLITNFKIAHQNDTFNTINGPYYESEFNLNELYPSKIAIDGNNSRGSYTNTGLDPGAYSGQNYDDYYFADFVTRIHKDDPMNGSTTATMIADCPDDARYPDGRYQLFSEVTDVREATFSSDTLSFVLDNWKPFIEEVTIMIGDVQIYHEEWICNNNCIEFTSNDLNVILANGATDDGMSIQVRASEYTDNLDYLTIGNITNDNRSQSKATEILYKVKMVTLDLPASIRDILDFSKLQRDASIC